MPDPMLYLVRHASAGLRGGLGERDSERPLDDVGVAQATAIAEWFGERRVDRIVSSPALRCRQTVEPVARVRRLRVEIDDDLFEGDHTNALGLVLALGEQGVHAVLASHGDIIPAVLLSLSWRGADIDRAHKCAKGSIWSLRVEDGRITSGEYTGPRKLG